MNKNDGGTAFPMQDPQAIHAYAQARTEAANSSDVNERDQIYLAARAEAVCGMSLRDYFAAKAMQSVISSSMSGPGVAKASLVRAQDLEVSLERMLADDAYQMADAMLAARAKP